MRGSSENPAPFTELRRFWKSRGVSISDVAGWHPSQAALFPPGASQPRAGISQRALSSRFQSPGAVPVLVRKTHRTLRRHRRIGRCWPVQIQTEIFGGLLVFKDVGKQSFIARPKND